MRAPRIKTVPTWRKPRHAITCAILAVGTVVAMMLYIDAWAAQVMLHPPYWLWFVFNEVTEFGRSGWFLWPMGGLIVAVAFLASPAGAYADRAVLAMAGLRIGFLFLAIALPSLFVTIIKRIIGRGRPLVGDEIDPFLFKQLVWRPEYASLPSGHATTAFAAAIALGVLWPKLRGAMFIYALLIALSRVVIDAHYVSDVLAGAIAGVVGALLVRDGFAARRLVLTIDSNGKVAAMPGPSFARIKSVARKLLAPSLQW